MNNYDSTSIESLDPFEHIRKYPGMYIGSKDIDGLHQCIEEILANSIDEFLNGNCTKILIRINKQGSIYVSDDGRGIPHDKLFDCFGKINTGGKFNNSGESGYNSSAGQHGVGAKAVNALSTRMIVYNKRDGSEKIIEFSKGKQISTETNKCDLYNHGLSVLFYPDKEIFETTKVNSVRLLNDLKEKTFLNKGLKIHYINEIENIDEVYMSKQGLLEGLNYLVGDNTTICKPFYGFKQEGNFSVEFALVYTNKFDSNIKVYTNNVPQSKGTHLTGFKTAWTLGLNSLAKEKKWVKDKDPNLSGADYEEGLNLILNFKMIEPTFKGQSKEELTSSEGRTYVQKAISEMIKEFVFKREKDFKAIVEKALVAKKAKDTAKKIKENNPTSKAKKKKKFLNLPTKLVDAYSKDRKKCELYIVEGNSAANSMVEARNPEFQAILPIRGKILAVNKASVDKIFANQEIASFIQAIGLEINPKTRKLVYNINNLRYGSIFLGADGDADGKNIKNLLLEMIWWLCPELVIKGHVYATMPPLFRITTKDNKYIFIRDEKELEKYKSENVGKKYLVNRNKG